MTDDVDFKRLVREAASETYSPLAQHCWPWQHRWTMWRKELKPGSVAQITQEHWWIRTCVRCGKPATRDIPL
jgi:hypothetical protein